MDECKLTRGLVLNTIPFGIGVAASTRVGNLIGAKSPSGARRAAYASALLSVITGTTVLIVLLATANVSRKV
jgi:MATE family multidrug resistance protein